MNGVIHSLLFLLNTIDDHYVQWIICCPMPFAFLSTHAFLILFFWGHIYHVAKCSRIKTTVSFTPSETMMMILKSAVTDMKNLVLGSAPMHIRPYKKCMRCMKTMPESSIQFQLFYSFFFSSSSSFCLVDCWGSKSPLSSCCIIIISFHEIETLETILWYVLGLAFCYHLIGKRYTHSM